MRRGLLWLAGLVMGLVLLGLGQVAIPFPEGAVMRLGTGWISGTVVFSPDGRYLVVGTTLGVELRDAQTLELVRFFPGHTGWVRSVAFSPDGKVLASGSWDGTVLLWALAFLIPQPPTVASLTFPGAVSTGAEVQGTLRFADKDADLVRAEFTVVEGPLPGFTLDLTNPPYASQVQGKTDGTFTFTLQVDQPGTYRIRVILVDAAGNRSEPYEFRFEAKTPTPPTITKVVFPSTIKVNQERNGIVRFQDADGDIVRAEFTVVEGDPATIRVSPALPFDPEVRGATSGAVRFTVVVTRTQTVVLRLVLVDSAGLRSDPVEFTFRME